MLLLLLPAASYAQTTVLKINPLSAAASTLNGSVEQFLGAGISLQLGAYYTGINYSDMAYSGWGITPEVRFYLSQEATSPTGWYIAPFARYSQLRLEREPRENQPAIAGEANMLAGGAVVGHQWLLGKQDRFSIDVFAGPKYSSLLSIKGSASEKDYATNIASGGLWLRSGLTLGFAF